jgi:hypothetical protein
MKLLNSLRKIFATFGVNPKYLLVSLKNLPGYAKDYLVFMLKSKQVSFQAPAIACYPSYPCLTDKNAEGGVASGHYFWQDLVVAQKIYSANPLSHLDIGSRMDGFVAHVASYRRLDVLDIRPINASIPNVNFIQGDMSNPHLPGSLKLYDSISCLHVLEHCGLGRYGDRLDPLGYIHAAKVIASLVKSSGTLYVSVPVGAERIEFNAHRVFDPDTILRLFQDQGLKIVDFAYVDDNGDFSACGLPQEEANGAHITHLSYHGYYGCGIFEFKKQ